MVVYVVLIDHVETRPTECSYEDGYYDDYYDEEFHSSTIVAICLNEELAKILAEKEDNKCGLGDSAYYVPYEVLESDGTYEEIFSGE